MQTKEYLEYIVDHIHSTVFATVDSQGHPVTCAIDMMDYDEGGPSPVPSTSWTMMKTASTF